MNTKEEPPEVTRTHLCLTRKKIGISLKGLVDDIWGIISNNNNTFIGLD